MKVVILCSYDRKLFIFLHTPTLDLYSCWLRRDLIVFIYLHLIREKMKLRLRLIANRQTIINTILFRSIWQETEMQFSLYFWLHRKTTAIWRIFVRGTDVSRHHGGPNWEPPEKSQTIIALWYLEVWGDSRCTFWFFPSGLSDLTHR